MKTILEGPATLESQSSNLCQEREIQDSKKHIKAIVDKNDNVDMCPQRWSDKEVDEENDKHRDDNNRQTVNKYFYGDRVDGHPQGILSMRRLIVLEYL